MYSVVLMAALTTGGQTQEFGKHGCNGCNGCYSSCYSGCYGGGGCYSSCYSSCHGGHKRHGCHGCFSSCYSSCYSGGCYGGGYTTGCYGGGCYGGGFGGGVFVQPPPAGGGKTPDGDKGPGKDKTPGGDKKGGKTDIDDVSAPATIQVNLPANAKLFVDGVATKSTSATRTLVTPALPAGQQYSYTLKAETVVNGQTLTQVQQITVQGGQQTPVSFSFNTQGVASSK